MFENIKQWAIDNKYELLDYIPGNWDRYWDGVPSVTTILSLLRDPWFEYVKKLYPDQLKVACDRGTRIHWEAEDFFDAWEPVIHSQIMKFHILHDVVIIGKENNYRRYWIQWTIDLECYYNGVHWLINVDYKSSAKKSKKYFLQMWGYKYLNGVDWGILYLSPKKFELVICPDEYEELFIELKNYFFTLLRSWQLESTLKGNISQQIVSLCDDIPE